MTTTCDVMLILARALSTIRYEATGALANYLSPDHNHKDLLIRIECCARDALESLKKAVPMGKTAYSAQARYDDALIRLDVLHLVVSALAAKADVSNEKLLGLFREAEEELRAKRWLT